MFGSGGLFGSAILDVAVGLFLLYLLLSLICSRINEIIASFGAWRAHHLETGLLALLGDQETFDAVMGHPLIGSQGVGGAPSYIPSPAFALALLESFVPTAEGPMTVSRVRTAAHGLIASAEEQKQKMGRLLLTFMEGSRDSHAEAQRLDDLKRVLATLPQEPDPQRLDYLRRRIAAARTLDEIQVVIYATFPPGSPLREPALDVLAAARADLAEVGYSLDRMRKSVESWFDDNMARLSGVYKRHVQKVMLAIAAITTLVSGADTFRFVDNLYTNPAVRSALVAEAVRQTSAGGTLAPAGVAPAPTVGVARTPTPGVAPTPTSGGTGGTPVVVQTTSRQGQAPSAATITSVVDALTPFSTLFGYGDYPQKTSDVGTWVSWILWKIVGLLATIFAVSLGAPFWFDLLQKLVNLRGTGQPPQRSSGTPNPAPAADQPS